MRVSAKHAYFANGKTSHLSLIKPAANWRPVRELDGDQIMTRLHLASPTPYYRAALRSIQSSAGEESSLTAVAAESALLYDPLIIYLRRHLGDDWSRLQMLELGCSPGVVVDLLAKEMKPMEIIGLEFEPLFVQAAREHGVNVIQGDLTAIPAALTNKQFDVVFSRWLLDVFIDNATHRRLVGHPLELKILKNIKTLTRVGGLNIHQVAPPDWKLNGFPFTRKEWGRAGFEMLETGLNGCLIVLHRLS
jgi:hypothetical protein